MVRSSSFLIFKENLEKSDLYLHLDTDTINNILIEFEKASNDEKEIIYQLQEKINYLNKLITEHKNNSKTQFSKREQQTIAFQLGKMLIDASKNYSSLKQLPKTSFDIILQSIERKPKNSLNKIQLLIKEIINIREKFNNIKLPETIKNFINEKNRIKNINEEKLVNLVQNASDDVKKINLKREKLKPTILQSSKAKIACIMDEFTSFCFEPEAEILQLHPEQWLKELKEFKPDFLFIESAWKGKDGLWHSKISNNTVEVIELIEYCRLVNIKTMFWNKEDPIHFGTFIKIAQLVDVVFTTDIDCIKRYKEILQHDEVYLLPFAAQPKLHNPIELYDRKDGFNFAGSYYLKYPERQRDFITLTDVAKKKKFLEIYDRNYEKPHPHYQFPEQFNPLIIGSLEPSEIDRAYKGYNYGINLNTIKQSQSMFARRVFEMLASNTVVMSNYSRGVRNFFGDLVICSDNEDELINQFNNINKDTLYLQSFKLQGLRKVLSEHTYEERLKYIYEKLNINQTKTSSHIAVILKVENIEQFNFQISQFRHQIFTNRTILIYNPKKLKLAISNSSYFIFNKSIELLKNLKQIDYTHLCFFNSFNYYGEYYLSDLFLSYKYLKEENIDIITKDSFYSNCKGSIELNIGNCYKFTNNMNLSRSMILKESEFIEKYVSNYLENDIVVYKHKAFSIDRLSFIESTSILTNYKDQELFQKILCTNLIGDQGVHLQDNLLPMAENIKYLPLKNRVESLSLQDLKTNSKFLIFSYTNDILSIRCNLENKHCYYLLAEYNISDFEKELFVSVIASIKGDIKLAFEYFDQLNNKIESYIQNNTLESKSITIPYNASKVKISLRFKGYSSIILNKIQCIFVKSIQENNASHMNTSDFMRLDNKTLFNDLNKPMSSLIKLSSQRNYFLIKSMLPQGKHSYLYLNKIYCRSEINLSLNSEFELIGDFNCEDFRIVFEYQNKFKQKISHSINTIIGGHALAIPNECEYIRIGFKLVGTGTAKVEGLEFGKIKLPINTFVGKSEVLVLAKQYPSYEDLYKYGFLHTRLRAYKKAGLSVDMFRLTDKSEEIKFSEFESIDVISNNLHTLDLILATGRYKKILVHLLDKNMWKILDKYQHQIEVVVWVHGAEIQVWQRRAFEFERLKASEIERQKKLSLQRKNLWQGILKNDLSPNTKFVFVSNYFLKESEQDLGVTFPSQQTYIIHNYIDSSFFQYNEKSIDARFNLLSIRPYASRKYANDITVNAILELSKYPDFDNFNISLYGDGDLFDETVKPLLNFKNVSLHKGFLTHKKIALLHQNYGLFLSPTRMDSQGVSRDEAMASGLVPITTAVTAIPEFVDENCGILVEGEDYMEMAKQIYLLSKAPDRFLELSKAASARTLMQCGFEATIGKEIKLLQS